MLRITKQTDYGIVLVSHMAAEPERLFAASDLAAEAQLPLPMVSKILKLLAREGVLVSHRGANGGYALARRPRQIAVSEVITALEGPIAVTECIDDGPGICDQEPVCPLRSNWQVINMAIRRALDGIMIADMSRPLKRLPQERDELVTLGRHAAGAAQTPAAG
jgi:FeS assembly SUF system regulator